MPWILGQAASLTYPRHEVLHLPYRANELAPDRYVTFVESHRRLQWVQVHDIEMSARPFGPLLING